MSDVWALVDPKCDALKDGLLALNKARRRALESGASHAGWKVGFNNLDIRPALGISSGVVGFLTDATRSTSGRVVVPDAGAAVEVEIAFVLSDSVGPHDADEKALGAIDSVAVAFEVVVIGELDITDALANDVWHHAYVLGAPIRWAEGVLADIEIGLTHNGEPVDVPQPSLGALEDVASMLRFTASGAAAIGGALNEGDLILSGSLASRLIWVSPGDHVAAHSGGLGALDLILATRSP